MQERVETRCFRCERELIELPEVKDGEKPHMWRLAETNTGTAWCCEPCQRADEGKRA